MQRRLSTVHQKRFEPQVPSHQDRDSAVRNQDQPALVHDAWAGWHYDVAEEHSIPLFASARKAKVKAARSDRVIAEFRVKSAREAETRVSEAVALAELEAYAEQTRGVLVTRHDLDLFSVTLSSLVPFGVTIEQDSARHSRHPNEPNPAPRPTLSTPN